MALTRALFFETSDPDKRDKYPPKWTLKREDYQPEGFDKALPSAYQAYMNSNSEFEAAMTICGDLHEWEILCRTKWFMKGHIKPAICHIGLETWREHKRLKDIDEQIKNLKVKADAGDTAAAKAIIQLLKEAEKTTKAGRPKKDKEKEDSGTTHIKEFLKRVK